MSKIERAIGAILVALIEVFLVPVLIPVMGGYAWAFIIGAILFPILVAWKGDKLKEAVYD